MQLDAPPRREVLIRDYTPGLIGYAAQTRNEADTHRYLLERRWSNEGGWLVFVMLNPSTATHEANDPTVTRCEGFARRERASGLIVVNIFSLRSTDPRALVAHPDPFGRLNDQFILDACLPSHRTVVAAWGAYGLLHGRGAEVARMLIGRGVDLQCLGTTGAGQPRHPLYLRASAPLIPYVPR